MPDSSLRPSVVWRRVPLLGRRAAIVRMHEQVKALRNETTRLRMQRDAWREAAHRDMLTGVLNRRGLYATAPTALAAADALAVVDINEFKHINDGLGHDVGDAVLVAVARYLVKNAGGGVVARLGGDEFALILVAPTPRPAAAWLPRVADALTAPIRVSVPSLAVGLSAGIVPIADRRASISELLRQADAAMYRAKAARPDDHALFRITGGDPYSQQQAATVRRSRQLRRRIV